ncbi:hypothetical protein [Limosilactobacillus gastricus]|uniref:hypothetical protein n=1 Tax=Limosilactobacillus gastricus TaxID=227942 RepID=UPI0026EBDCDB|nr:hypothetical protein [Limosilactobacillus gastricus]
MINYLHFTAGTRNILQGVIDSHPDRQFKLATTMGSSRYYLFDLSNQPQSVFATPVTLLGLAGDDEQNLKGVVHLESFNNDDRQKEILTKKAQSLISNLPDHCYGGWLFVNERDTNNLMLITCWEDEHDVLKWQDSAQYDLIREFSGHDAKNMRNMYYHDNFEIVDGLL